MTDDVPTYVVSMILACMFLDMAIDMKKMFTQCRHYK